MGLYGSKRLLSLVGVSSQRTGFIRELIISVCTVLLVYGSLVSVVSSLVSVASSSVSVVLSSVLWRSLSVHNDYDINSGIFEIYHSCLFPCNLIYIFFIQ